MHIEPGADCVLVSDNYWVEECDVTSELISTAPVIVGIFGLIVIFIAAGTLLILLCNVKSKYDALIDSDHIAVRQSEPVEVENLN